MTSDQFLVCLNDWLDSAPELPDSGSYEASVSQLNQKHSTIGLLQRVQDGTTSVRLTPCSPEDISTALVAKNSLVSSERLTRVTFAEDLVDVREISKLESPLESDCESPEKKSPPEPVEWHLEKIAIKELPKLIFPPMENKWPIRVTQFDSPDRFFFQLIGPDYYHSYTRMQEDLQLFYLNNFAILPKVTHSDMSCMYACRIEDVYSRAAITEVLAGDHLVRVKLIDLGDCQIVPRSDLRLLHKKYSKLSPQCISARLHNVDFTNNKLAITVQSVVEFLHLQVDNRNLFVRVMEIDSDGSLLAELIDESDPCEPVSINAALSELLADQMDKCQQQLSSEMSHLVIEDTSTQLQSGEIAGLSPTSTISTVDDGYFGSMASRSGLSGVIIPPYQNLSVRSQMDVMITSIEDPTCFYVQPADFTSKFLAEIEAQMCDFYKDTTGGNEVDLCASAPFCAVNLHFLDIGYNKWLRGFLMSQSHHRAEVLLVDSGEVVNVTVGDLRPIDSRFTWLPMQAIKVRSWKLKSELFFSYSWGFDLVLSPWYFLHKSVVCQPHQAV